MAGILYVVATPIGNLEDVTLRALRILREVSVIAAEDTRRTARLLQHYSISTRTTSLHEHNEHEKTPKLIQRLIAGESVALVSDAGTPLVSDPGKGLVTAAREEGIRVESIPGPSAIMAAIASSGLADQSFTFLGFAPQKSGSRRAWLESVADEPRLVVFFEAPHRIVRLLSDMQELLGGDRVVGVARELTKKHEELVIRPIAELLQYFKDPRGEFTILVSPRVQGAGTHSALPDDAMIGRDLGELTNNAGLKRRAALKILAERYGIGVNELYRLIAGGAK
jgi:16S rRNA (cytidine1402-2'-O)-methyltransferase